MLTDPLDTGAVVFRFPRMSSPKRTTSRAMFEPRDWKIVRPMRGPGRGRRRRLAMLTRAGSPLIIAGGGIHYSDAHAELETLAGQTGIPRRDVCG